MNKIAAIATVVTLCAGINIAQAHTDNSTQSADLSVYDAEVQAPQNGSTEVKMNIKNQSDKTVDIIAAYSPVDTKTQLHHFVTNNKGQRVMKQISTIEVYPHNEVDLSFQELHIMLIGLKDKLKEGSTVPLYLIMEDGSTVPVKAKVD